MLTAQTAALLATLGFAIIAVFQAALALGAPLGRAAWGGGHEGRLPASLRRSSAVAVLVWVIAAVVILGRAGTRLIGLPDPVFTWGAWILGGVLVAGALMNFASSSPWERFGWGPLALVLAGLCLVVATSTL